MTSLRNARQVSVDSDGNSTTTPLTASSTFTGTGELNSYPDVFVSIATDQNGEYFLEFSPDGTNWDSSIPYKFRTDGISTPHSISKGNRYFRIRFTNTSSSDQTYLRIKTSYGINSKLTGSLNNTLSDTFDATATRPSDYFSEVAAGKRDGRTTWDKFGFNNDIDAGAAEVVASFGGTYTPMTSSGVLTVVSTSANDTSGGTGARTIKIIGPAGADRISVTEEVTMNGTTSVDTSNEFWGVNRVEVESAGSLTYNAGDINITDPSANTQAQIPAEAAITQQAIFHTQNNHRFIIDGVFFVLNKISGGGSPRATIRGYEYESDRDVRYLKYKFTIDSSVQNSLEYSLGVKTINQNSTLYFTAETDTNNTVVEVRFHGIEERLD